MRSEKTLGRCWPVSEKLIRGRAWHRARRLGLGLSVVAAGPAMGDLTVDQQHLVHDNGTGTASGPKQKAFGQSFTPALESIEWADFSLAVGGGSGPVSVSMSFLNGPGGLDGLGANALSTSPAVTVSSTSFSM